MDLKDELLVGDWRNRSGCTLGRVDLDSDGVRGRIQREWHSSLVIGIDIAVHGVHRTIQLVHSYALWDLGDLDRGC